MNRIASLRRNVAANAAGKAVSAAVSLGLVPFYVRLMGIESYGLVGVYTLLLTLFSVLDLGLSTTLNRALARLTALPDGAPDARSLVRTLECLYWAVGALLGVLLVALAPLIARSWVRSQGLSVDAVAQALAIMGLVLAFQWPVALYMGGLMGLQRQVLLNGVLAVGSLVQGGGALLVLWLVAPTVQAFFLWQIIVNALQTGALAICLWRSLPAAPARPTIQWRLLHQHGAFAAGMTGISLLSVLLTQLDKIVLSRILPLQLFGYYTLAAVVANGLTYLSQPVFSALFPRFSQLVAAGSPDLAALYRQGCELIALAIVPAAATVALFAPELLALWVRDPVVVANTATLVRLGVIGTALNGLMLLPFALQLAHGWVSLSLWKNVVALVVLAPLLVVMTTRYGAVGAPIVWIALNTAYVLVEIPLMHRRILPGQQRFWYLVALLLPISVCLAIGLPLRALLPANAPALASALYVAAVAVALLAATALALPTPRSWFQRDLLRLRASLLQVK